MTKRMLIDATHAEETRVVVLDGNRLEDFDVETSTKKQLKGNIYLAKVVRVEPSLQAAFVEYGGGRHGFLAFGEIHPDYYQIPVADRQRLLEIAAEEAREEEEAEERREAGWAVRADVKPQRRDAPPAPVPAPAETIETVAEPETAVTEIAIIAAPPPEPVPEPTPEPELPASEPPIVEIPAPEQPAPEQPITDETPDAPRTGPAQAAVMPTDTRYGDADAETSHTLEPADETLPPGVVLAGDAEGAIEDGNDDDSTIEVAAEIAPPPEVIGGESDQFEGNGAEEASRRRSSRMLRNYRIQEVIRRRQILLIQVVKEERGTKGAALTTYISLAGRYCVLMPNSPRGGGISRKITSSADRKRLKEITNEMEIPKGMGLIVRTAGANRPKPEIRRDCEYLMRLWDDIREHTLRSTAPALIYEEASLIKRSIRDVYSRDVDEIIVDGEEGWRQAHDFMRMLMPSHAKKVQLWRPQGVAMPLFAKHQVDLQLDAMLAPTVQLRSGGYLVINQTEALVAIDVNSGRSTRERGIEETALKTNLEAADEVARQLRLRDLAGLIVIDFIDMEARKHNAMVERRMKDALKNDRARIQLGSISHFGLLEMSRQRLRPSLAETSFVMCPHCNGLGHVRSVESSAIHVLRAVEEEGAKLRAAAILVHAAPAVVMYILNNKRDRLGEIEARYAMRVSFAGDDTLLAPAVRIDRLRPQVPEAERLLSAAPVAVAARPMDDYDDTDDADVVAEEEPTPPARAEPAAPRGEATPPSGEATSEEAEQRRRRRRRRRGGRRDGTAPGDSAQAGAEGEEDGDDDSIAPSEPAAADLAPPAGLDDTLPPEAALEPSEGGEIPSGEQLELDENGEPKSRRRGRRGGRRRRRGEPGSEITGEETAEADSQAPPAPSYTGPTPADPFGKTYDIFDMLEQAQQSAEPEVAAVTPEPVAEPVVAIAAVTPGESVTSEAQGTPEAVAFPEPEPAPEPAIRPIVIGADPAPDAAPKKGWWRR
jgi:ribonuclease E